MKENSEEKKCSESCGCVSSKETMLQQAEEKKLEKKVELDPTHFGDWQVNCRAIDF